MEQKRMTNRCLSDHAAQKCARKRHFAADLAAGDAGGSGDFSLPNVVANCGDENFSTENAAPNDGHEDFLSQKPAAIVVKKPFLAANAAKARDQVLQKPANQSFDAVETVASGMFLLQNVVANCGNEGFSMENAAPNNSRGNFTPKKPTGIAMQNAARNSGDENCSLQKPADFASENVTAIKAKQPFLTRSSAKARDEVLQKPTNQSFDVVETVAGGVFPLQNAAQDSGDGNCSRQKPVDFMSGNAAATAVQNAVCGENNSLQNAAQDSGDGNCSWQKPASARASTRSTFFSEIAS